MRQGLTKNQREQLKQLVVYAQIKRLSPDEALGFIKEKSGIAIKVNYYHKLKAAQKDAVGERLTYLMKDRHAYTQEFLDRIDELKSLQTDLYEIIKDNPDNPELHRKCINDLHALTLSINSLNDLLPEYTQGIIEFDKYTKASADKTKDSSDADYSDEAKF